MTQRFKNLAAATVTVKGSKGELTRTFSELVAIAQEGESARP